MKNKYLEVYMAAVMDLVYKAEQSLCQRLFTR